MPRSAPLPLATRQAVDTPEGIDLMLWPAGLLVRAIAFALDRLMRGALLVALALLTTLASPAGDAWAEPVPLLVQPAQAAHEAPLPPASAALGPQSPRLLNQALTSQAAQQAVQAIVLAPPFKNTQAVNHWRWKQPGEPQASAPTAARRDFPAWPRVLAQVVEVLLWGLLLAPLILLVWHRRAARPSASMSTGTMDAGRPWSRKPRNLVLLGVLTLLLLMLGIYVARHLERYSETVDKGADPGVAANPYLAAQRFLRQRGLRVDQANRLDVLARLPAASTSLLLLGDRSHMSPSQAEQVLAWVRQGGRLVFVAEALWDERQGHSDDLLLDRVQLRQFETRTLPPAQPSADPFPRLTKLYLDNEAAPAYFSFNPAFHLEDPTDISRSWANSSEATHLMQFEYGDGVITVVTDADLWRNSALGRYDNAWLLWYLNQNRDVALIYPTDHDTLAQRLWRYFPHAVILLLVWLVLFAWHSSGRYGPVRPPPPARSRLREYLQANAAFMLRHGGHDRLLRSLQHDILRHARRRHPGFERLAVADQWHALARLTGESPSAVGQALRPRPAQKMSHRQFTRHVGYLQRLRNAL